MTIIGRIDIEKYKCITPDIATDEVIITDERIAHIKAHHPEDYERFFSYIPAIIELPDFIIADRKPNTAIVLKTMGEKDERFRLILRLVTSNDNPSYKNSVLSFWKTHNSEWERLIKNKKILYSRE